MDKSECLLTSREVGEILQMHAETVRKWAREGRIESVTLPSGRKRYRREDIERLLSRGAA